jgi:lipopolysaccharide export LptBFGC system permease protein LptF
MIHIREMKETDKPSLRQLYLDSRRVAFYWSDPESMHLADFDHDTKEEHVFIAALDQRIIGLFLCIFQIILSIVYSLILDSKDKALVISY